MYSVDPLNKTSKELCYIEKKKKCKDIKQLDIHIYFVFQILNLKNVILSPKSLPR